MSNTAHPGLRFHASVTDKPPVGPISVHPPQTETFTYNDDAAPSGAATTEVEPAMTNQWSLAGQSTVKIGIRKPGWYRIMQPELVAAGLGAGDGASDIVAYRPSTGVWYILQSSSGYATHSATQWGLGGDVPVVERR